MGIESVAFLFSKVFWVHGEHDMRTQVYYTVAVMPQLWLQMKAMVL